MLMVMVFSLVGCKGKDAGTQASVSTTENASTAKGDTETEQTAADTSISADSPYAGMGFDLSDKVNIVMYVLGDAPADLQKVVDEANSKYFEPNLNCTLEIKFLNWSDYQTKYSLVLAGGEQVDLMYTASWCYYNEEVAKGAFKELTMDFIQQYMPYTYKEQPSESWDQISIDGKIYAVPKAKASFNGYNIVQYRQDLVDKYKLTAPTSWDTFKEYLYGLAEVKNETGVTPFATNANRNQTLTLYSQSQKIEALASGFDYYYFNHDSEDAPNPADVFYLYTSDLYLNYCKEMAELAAHNVWSSDAISDTSDAQAYFENGTSGAFVWNSSVYNIGKTLESAGLGTYAVADITPDSLRRRGSYADDATAIATNSKNQERAALVLDYMKSDVNLNRLLLGGIVGTHYNLDADGNRVTLDAATNYPWNGWGWAINRADEPNEAGLDERQIAMDKQINSKEYVPQTAGFSFDASPVNTEYSVVNAVRDEYIKSFSLGIFGDQTEDKFNEFKKKLQDAGLDKITAEITKQYDAYLDRKGLK